MNIQLKTTVKGNFKSIMARFDRELFEALAPPFPPLEVVEFTGSREGDRVHIRFLDRINWISLITEDGENDTEAWFVDEGEQLPFPLTYWRHRHIVRKVSEDTSCIIDDITYRAGNPLFTLLMYPALYMGFYPRKRLYRNYFGRP